MILWKYTLNLRSATSGIRDVCGSSHWQSCLCWRQTLQHLVPQEQCHQIRQLKTFVIPDLVEENLANTID